MFLHIEEERLISINDIIGVFDLSELNKNKENRNFTFRFKDEDRLKKTLILINKNEKIEEIFSNLSVTTLEKRINKKNKFDV